MIFPNFKVLDIILEVAYHFLNVNGNNPVFLEEVCYIQFYFLFYFFLGDKDYVVPYGTVVTGILDMRPGKHDLHFLVDVELLPHAFVNIPNEKMHIGVFIFVFVIYFTFLFFYIFILIFIHIIRSFLPIKIQL
jgi:hypothetical protein